MLGSMLLRYLCRDLNFAIYGTSRRTGTNALTFEVGSADSLREFLGTHGPFPYIINCIAILRRARVRSSAIPQSEMVRINGLFPHELAAVASEFGSRLIHVSTDAVFHPTAGKCRPSDFPAPADLYGRTKLVGEPFAENAITVRCSLVGPSPVRKQGLFEWIISQPQNATIQGFEDQSWNGVTTLQFAQMCLRILQASVFDILRAGSPVHHFCPNAAVTKYELVQLLVRYFRPDLQLQRSAGGAVTRTLVAQDLMREMFGTEQSMEVAIKALSTYTGALNELSNRLGETA